MGSRAAVHPVISCPRRDSPRRSSREFKASYCILDASSESQTRRTRATSGGRVVSFVHAVVWARRKEVCLCRRSCSPLSPSRFCPPPSRRVVAVPPVASPFRFRRIPLPRTASPSRPSRLFVLAKCMAVRRMAQKNRLGCAPPPRPRPILAQRHSTLQLRPLCICPHPPSWRKCALVHHSLPWRRSSM